MKYKVIVFGSLPIATKITQWVRERGDCSLEGVVLTKRRPHNNDPWKDVPCLEQYVEQNGIPVFELTSLVELYNENELDLGLTCRFAHILKPEVFSRFSVGIVNMHGGLLPEFAGLYSCNHTLLSGSKVGGGTIHYIDEGIDTGDVIKRCEFPIEADDTGYTVFQKTQIALYEGMIEVIPKVLAGVQESTPIVNLVDAGHPSRYYDIHSIDGEKQIDFWSMDADEILRRVRAFDFPGYEPAYAEVAGHRVYLRMS